MFSMPVPAHLVVLIHHVVWWIEHAISLGVHIFHVSRLLMRNMHVLQFHRRCHGNRGLLHMRSHSVMGLGVMRLRLRLRHCLHLKGMGLGLGLGLGLVSILLLLLLLLLLMMVLLMW